MSLFIAALIREEDKSKLQVPLNYFKQHSSGSDYEDLAALHITIKEISNDDQHKEIINLLREWNNRYRRLAFTVQAKDFYNFNNSNNSISWIGINNSLPLYQIKFELEQIAQKMNIPIFNDKFKYTPHITVAFNAECNKNFNSNFKPIDLVIDRIVLWGYDHKIKNVHLASTLYIINLQGNKFLK